MSMYRRALSDADVGLTKPVMPLIQWREIPSQAITDAPNYSMPNINAEWLPHIIGALAMLDQPDAWNGTETEVQAARSEVRRIIALIEENL